MNVWKGYCRNARGAGQIFLIQFHFEKNLSNLQPLIKDSLSSFKVFQTLLKLVLDTYLSFVSPYTLTNPFWNQKVCNHICWHWLLEQKMILVYSWCWILHGCQLWKRMKSLVCKLDTLSVSHFSAPIKWAVYQSDKMR